MALVRVGPRGIRSLLLAMAALVALSGAIPAQAATSWKILEGRLVSIHGDDFGRGRSHFSVYLETAKERVRLRVPGSDHGLPLGSVVRVRGTGLSDGSFEVAAAGGVSAMEVLEAPAAATGTKNVAVLLINFTNDTSKPWTTSTVNGVMFTNTNSIADYFNEESYGKLTVTGAVHGWYTIPYSNSGCTYSTWASAARSAASSAGVNLSQYTNIVYAFPRTTSCSWAGLAYMPGTDSFANGYMQLSVVGHELSHNFGVHHASTYRCMSGSTPVFLSSSCTASEYGDPFTIMGAAQTRHSNNWHRGQMGWLSAGETVTATATGTYTVAAAELTGASPKVVRVARPGGKYLYLEYRRPFGTSFDNFSSSDPAVNGVSIRMAPDYPTITQSQLLDATPSTLSFNDAPLAAGKSVTDPDTGIKITTQSVSSTAAAVSIAFPTADAVPPSAPTNLSGQRTKPRQVRLTWTASTDNVGVAGYLVYRDGAPIRSLLGLTFTDRPPRRTVMYYVVAYDEAGNISGPSNSISV